MINDFDYRNISYHDQYLEYVKKFPGKPDWLFKALAKHFDQMYWYNEVSEKNAVGFSTAVTDEAKLDKLHMLNYYPQEVSPVGCSVLLDIDSISFPIIIYKEDLIFDITVSGKSYRYYSATDITATSRYTTVALFEGTPFEQVIGTTVAGVANQRFTLPYKKVIWNLINVNIDGTPYIRKYHLMDSAGDAAHFRNYFKMGYQQLEFGDDTYGMIPNVGAVEVSGFTCNGEAARAVSEKTIVTESFVSIGGASQAFTLTARDIQKFGIRIYIDAEESQAEWVFTRDVSGFPVLTIYDLAVGALDIVYARTDGATINYAGDSALIANMWIDSNMTGGADAEDLEKSIELAPKRLEVSNRLATEFDYYVLSKMFSSDILEVKVFPFYYGAGTIGVHIIPKGGGEASLYLLNTLSAYLNDPDRRYMDNNTIMVDVALKTYFDFDYEIKINSGYSFKDYMELSKMAIFLFIGENYKEYLNIYKTSGSQELRAALNAKLGLTLKSSKIGELIPVFDLVKRAQRKIWENEVTLDTIIAAIRSFVGIKQVIINTPVATITTVADRVSTVGTLTCTEII